MIKKIIALFLVTLMIVGLLPISVFAAHRASDGYPTNLEDNVILSVYTGSSFPGEPTTHTVTSRYTSFNSSFAESGSSYATSATGVLLDSIRTDLIQGTTILNRYYTWGVFDTSTGATSDGLAKYFVDGANNPIFNDANETKMIAAAKNISETAAAAYEIVWYVVKFQTSDTAWHIDGIVRERNTFSVNYYGTGSTSGSAPDGTYNILPGSSYTILSNPPFAAVDRTKDGDLARRVAGVDYIFTGWNTAADGSGTAYTPGQTVTIISDLSLYPQWQAENQYTATVNIYLDYELIDVQELHPGISLFISKDDATFIKLNESSTEGVYTATVEENGEYFLYHEETNGDYEKVGEYFVEIVNNNGQLDVPHFSVAYNLEGGNFESGNSYNGIYFAGTVVPVAGEAPKKDGYYFLGWDEDDTTYQPLASLGAINEPHVLVAQWAETSKVNVDITFVTETEDGIDADANEFDYRIILTRRAEGSNTYTEVHGNSVTKSVVIPGDGSSVTESFTSLFTDLSPLYDYNASIIVDDYIVEAHTVTENPDGTYNVNITLRYKPDGFNLYYTVQTDSSVPSDYIPLAVDLKISYWDGDAWEYIDEHAESDTTENSVDVGLTSTNADGTKHGSGHYFVFGFNGDTPYYYRVEVIGVDVSNIDSFGNVESIEATETTENEVYTALPFTATVTVANGGKPVTGALDGAYAIEQDSGDTTVLAQQGEIVVTLSMTPYDVTFMANGGKVNGNDTETVSDIYQIPSLENYVPTRDGSYVFEAWYVDKDTDGILDAEEITSANKVHGGEWLSGDVTLIANWKEPLTISGTVTIEGTYELGGENVDVHDVDRAKSAVVVIEEIGKEGAAFPSQTLDFTYSGDDTASATYSFTVPDDGRAYEIFVRVNNYTDTYDSEPIDGTYASVTEDATANDAIFDGDNTAIVNAHLDFTPEAFDLAFIIDAAPIGAGFRPTGALAVIYYRDLGDSHAGNIISQHTVEPYGVLLDLNEDLDSNGIAAEGEGEYSVWKYHYDGSLYGYQVSPSKLYGDVDGVFAADGSIDLSNAPYYIVYADSAAWRSIDNTVSGGFDGRGTLKATLHPNTYTITFDLNAGNDTVTGMEDFIVEDGDTVAYETSHTWSFDTDVTAIPARLGYTFKGWKLEGSTYDADGEFTVPAETYGDFTLVAEWEQIKYTVAYDLDGGSTSSETLVYNDLVYGSDTPTIADPTKTGATFAGWSPAVRLRVTENAIYTATWTVDKYTVVYTDGAEGAAFSNQRYSNLEYGDETPQFNGTPTRTGYTFNGWSPAVADTVSGNATYRATWTENKYTLSYENTSSLKPDAADIPADITGITHGSSTALAPASTTSTDKDGVPGTWTFEGWYRSSDLTGSALTRVNNITSDTSVYAKWSFTPYTYTLTYHNTAADRPAYARIPASIDGIDYSELVDLTSATPASRYKNGVPGTWTFEGWYLDEALTQPAGASVTVIEDTDVYAKWSFTATTYTVTYTDGVDGEEVFGDQSAEGLAYNADTPAFTGTPARPGYTFKGWTPAVAEKVTEDVTYTAVWEKEYYTVIYDTNGGVSTTNGAVNGIYTFDDLAYGETTPVIVDPTYAGKTFTGWTPAVVSTVSGNITYTATWDADLYTVTYIDGVDNEEVFADQSNAGLLYGATTPAFVGTPTRTGYTFEGWTPTVESTVSRDITYTATWTQNKYTVTYTDGVDGKEIFADQVTENLTHGTATPVFGDGTNPTRTGYTFEGWSPEVADTVTDNATYVAQWKVKATPGGGAVTTKYTLTYKTNGGTEYDSEKYEKGTVVKLDKTPEKENYTFAGWFEDEALTKKIEKVTMDKNRTVYAGWNYITPPDHPVPGDLDGEHHIAYIIGYPDDTVRPLEHITRAEVSTILFRLLKEEVRTANLTEENAYTDVEEGAWYNSAISTLTKMGIVDGRTETEFMPDEYITRAEFATFCARFDTTVVEFKDDFSDIDDHWAAAYIHKAAARGWVKGYEDGTFRPDGLITRAEAMALINRVLCRIPENTDDLLDSMIKWPDNADTSAWYYLDVQEATNSHTFEYKADTEFEKWIKLVENPDWEEYND